jgi:hypothetical protein
MTTLADVAPRLGRAQEQLRAERGRGISRCWQNRGYHVYGAGPCFDTMDQAVAYRDWYDREEAAGRDPHTGRYL